MAGVFGAGVKPGFNQGGGGYYIVLSTIAPAQLLSYSGGSGSGGAYAVGTVSSFAAYNTTPANLNYSVAFTPGKLLKDMGRTVVSSGRTFRKFQLVVNTSASNSSPTFGVGGSASTATQPNYLTTYLEIGREGAGIDAGASVPALIARFA